MWHCTALVGEIFLAHRSSTDCSRNIIHRHSDKTDILRMKYSSTAPSVHQHLLQLQKSGFRNMFHQYDYSS